MYIVNDADPQAKKAKCCNRPPYPEKGLIAGLQSTADKLSVIATKAMQEDQLTEEALASVRILVEQAEDFLTRIEQEHIGSLNLPIP